MTLFGAILAIIISIAAVFVVLSYLYGAFRYVPYVPTKHDVVKKMENLSYPKGYSIRPVLIHVSGITQGVRESGIFTNIIDFSEFLNR